MIDKLDIASKNWADDYMTRFGRRFNNMLRDAFIDGFKKGVALSKPILCKDCKIKSECMEYEITKNDDFFCGYGERKDGETDGES